MNKQQHEKWLRKMGVHPEQLKQRKRFSNKPKSFGVAKDYYGNLANSVAPPVLVTSIWETIRTGNESPETIRQIHEKAGRVGPAFNKGGLQLIPANEIKYAGKK